MTFTIHKHVGGDWSVEKPIGTLAQLGWDEMLGEVAMILMAGRPHRFSAHPAPSYIPFASIYSLAVSEAEAAWYTIRRGNLFIDRLACNEALGFLAAYTLTDGERQLFRGLQTYEYWQRQPWNRKREIAGLLAYQPEFAA